MCVGTETPMPIMERAVMRLRGAIAARNQTSILAIIQSYVSHVGYAFICFSLVVKLEINLQNVYQKIF